MKYTRIEFRQGSPEEWLNSNPILNSGEPGYEIGTGKFKIGNGINSWNDLPYFSGEGLSVYSPNVQTDVVENMPGILTVDEYIDSTPRTDLGSSYQEYMENFNKEDHSGYWPGGISPLNQEQWIEVVNTPRNKVNHTYHQEVITFKIPFKNRPELITRFERVDSSDNSHQISNDSIDISDITNKGFMVTSKISELINFYWTAVGI